MIDLEKYPTDVPDDFAVYILSHGRADNVITLSSLLRCGYTGKWYIIIDNEDDTAQDYYDKFGEEHVIMFDKPKKAKEFDTMDTFGKRNTIVYARNACFDIAKEQGIKRFLQLDDDYTSFRQRAPRIRDGKEVLIAHETRHLNVVFNWFLDFLETSNALTVCFAQGGDCIGGLDGLWVQKLRRKAMNSFFCNTDRPINFIGHLNEDVNAYVDNGSRGELMFTVTDFMLTQVSTQSNDGGMTDAYLDGGTYLKSFYSVMVQPSSVKVSMMGTSHRRLHHKVNWNNAVPKILNPDIKKLHGGTQND